MRVWSNFVCLVAVGSMVVACSPVHHGGGGHDAGTSRDAIADSGRVCPTGSMATCSGALAITCDSNGVPTNMQNCLDLGQVCVEGIGCAMCRPGRRGCDGAATTVCRTDGSGFDHDGTCDSTAGESCSPDSGMCVNLCAAAETSSSYIGCDYWPISSLNSEVPHDFSFAVVVANPQTVPAQIIVKRGTSTVATRTVAANGLETITLPWVDELKGTSGMMPTSTLVHGGAYHLTSSEPVTVYQFNALEYSVPHDCPAEATDVAGDNQCFSFSNDSSLLLPTHVLTGNYLVMARPNLLTTITTDGFPQTVSEPGYFTVVGADTMPVMVTITFRGHVQASGDGSIRSYNPGEMGTFMVGPGDALQIVGQANTTCPATPTTETVGTMRYDYCPLGNDQDFTGTEIRATGKIAVFGGHNCDFVPYNRWACDHLEEELFPVETWGHDIVVAATHPLRHEPNLIRVLSSHAGNNVTFDPPLHAPVTLGAGEFLEVTSGDDVRIVGSEALLVAQFLVGQNYSGFGSAGAANDGDPSMSLAIPTEQFRSSYEFLAPESYTVNYVNVTAQVGQTVTLDGMDIASWRQVSATTTRTARVAITGGPHHITSDMPFGIVVYGFGSFTSYMNPGGLDLQMINMVF